VSVRGGYSELYDLCVTAVACTHAAVFLIRPSRYVLAERLTQFDCE